MGRKTANAISELHGHNPKPVKAEPEPIHPEKNLDDPKVQAEILNPMPMKITLDDGSEITLHEPSAKLKRLLIGFTGTIFFVAQKRKGFDVSSPTGANPSQEELVRLAQQNGFILTMGCRNLLCSDAKDDEGRLYQDRLFELVVQMYDKPGKITPERGAAFAAELSESVTADDIIKLLAALTQIAAITAPKK
jgi:hypothetical protein